MLVLLKHIAHVLDEVAAIGQEHIDAVLRPVLVAELLQLVLKHGDGALEILRLFENRCNTSILQLSAIDCLLRIAAMTEGEMPVRDNPEAIALCEEADRLSREYMRLHAKNMPDRGAQGTLVSYNATIPVYIERTRRYFCLGDTACDLKPATWDAPPPPDTDTK